MRVITREVGVSYGGNVLQGACPKGACTNPSTGGVLILRAVLGVDVLVLAMTEVSAAMLHGHAYSLHRNGRSHARVGGTALDHVEVVLVH